MSEKNKQTGAFVVDPLVKGEEDESVLLEEPRHIVNEIINNTNAFAQAEQEGLSAMLYLGTAQRYALRFLKAEGLIDPMQGTFAGIPMIFVEQPYHVNLVARRDVEEQG